LELKLKVVFSGMIFISKSAIIVASINHKLYFKEFP